MQNKKRQHLQLLWVARSGRHGKGRGDVVPKGPVVCMLLHRHELDGVVPQLGYPRQHVVCASAATPVRTTPKVLPNTCICDCSEGGALPLK